MPKYLGTGGKETKYNVDYVTTGSILKEFCGFLQLFAMNCLLIYSKIYIANTNSESLTNIFPIFAPKLRNRSQVKSKLYYSYMYNHANKYKCMYTCRVTSPTHGNNLSESLHQEKIQA